MKIATSRESLLKPLQAVVGVVERRQTMPVLANVLLSVRDGDLTVTATDLEVELVAETSVGSESVPGEITVPGRKLLDICRSLPEEGQIGLQLEGDRMLVRCGRSRFVLSTLPAAEFPLVDRMDIATRFTLSQQDFSRLLNKTQFAMAQQDVRYYLNGLLLETGKGRLRAVATDGHRLAMCDIHIENQDVTAMQVIVPRKGVLELHRLLGGAADIEISLGSNHIRAGMGSVRFTSKLIDGRFPDYERVLPTGNGSALTAERELLRQALARAAILSNEKYRGVRLELGENTLKIQANNPDQEEAHDEIEVSYRGEAMEVGFNVNYLLDALAAVDGEKVEIDFIDPNSSCLIKAPGNGLARFVVMPMRL